MTAISRGKKDLNQDEIVEQCNAAGMLVEKFNQFRAHKFDLLIGYEGLWLPVEIKRSVKSKLTEHEMAFWTRCKVKVLPICHATCFKDILIAFTQEKNK